MKRALSSSGRLGSSIFLAAVVGCGGIAVFDDGAGGAGAGAGTTSGGKTTSTKTSSANVGSTSFVASTGFVAASTGFTSTAIASTGFASAVTTGSGQLLPCELECQNDPGCSSDPPFPGGQCSQCVLSEAMDFTNSMCAINGAFGPQCQSDAECSDFVQCLIKTQDIQGCAASNPGGLQKVLTQVFASCARCGQCPTCQECCVPPN